MFEPLLRAPGVKLERIVSHGRSLPAGEWYDQAWDEWVMVLAGAPRLLIEDAHGEAAYDLGPGAQIVKPGGSAT